MATARGNQRWLTEPSFFLNSYLLGWMKVSLSNLLSILYYVFLYRKKGFKCMAIILKGLILYSAVR